jgi:hypothetical protein
MSVAAAPIAWPGRARCAASFSFDVDAESAMLAVSTEHANRMSAISHQAYGPLAGVPRLLRILGKHDRPLVMLRAVSNGNSTIELGRPNPRMVAIANALGPKSQGVGHSICWTAGVLRVGVRVGRLMPGFG